LYEADHECPIGCLTKGGIAVIWTLARDNAWHAPALTTVARGDDDHPTPLANVQVTVARHHRHASICKLLHDREVATQTRDQKSHRWPLAINLEAALLRPLVLHAFAKPPRATYGDRRHRADHRR